MKGITFDSSMALLRNEYFKRSNTKVLRYIDNVVALFLHDNRIATYDIDNKKLLISSCGWHSNTTKERLNGILETFNIKAKIYQKNFAWFISYKNKTYIMPLYDCVTFDLDNEEINAKEYIKKK